MSKPVSKLRDGAISAAIWKNSTDDGKHFYSVTFSRTYTDDAGNAQSSDSFSSSEILRVAHLAAHAYDRIATLRNEDQAA